ncbi:MAG: hypothetical protein WCO14_03295 [bacterium]
MARRSEGAKTSGIIGFPGSFLEPAVETQVRVKRPLDHRLSWEKRNTQQCRTGVRRSQAYRSL